MGKLILCSGERTKRPYGFTSGGVRIYSIEELCYYLYHHVYLIEETMFSEDLFDWIGSELKLPERAQKLKQLKSRNSDLKTIVTVILCSADYYSENEIKGLLKVLDDVVGMPPVKRNCMKADSYLKNKNYMEAAAEYEKIINSKEAAELSPEEYGDIYHNLAAAKVHISGLKEASRLFCEAYVRNHREESLRQYLYTLLIADNEAEFLEKAEEYQASGELKQEILDYIRQKENEAMNSELMGIAEHLKERKSHGKVSEFRKMTEDIIDGWKATVRQL